MCFLIFWLDHFLKSKDNQPACDFVKGIKKTPKTYLNFKKLVKKCKNLTHLLSNAAKYVMKSNSPAFKCSKVCY